MRVAQRQRKETRQAMSDSNKDIHDLAAQYLDLWQKQLSSQSSERLVQDSLKLSDAFNQQAAEMMKTLDTPEKIQTWMESWTESWKEQFKDGTNPFAPFTPPKTGGPTSASPASEYPEHNVDELSERLTLLEKRVRELESRLESTGRKSD